MKNAALWTLVAALALSAVTVPLALAQDVELDAIVIEGRILRPQAAYIIQRASVEYGIEAKKRSFVAKIESSIDEKAFNP